MPVQTQPAETVPAPAAGLGGDASQAPLNIGTASPDKTVAQPANTSTRTPKQHDPVTMFLVAALGVGTLLALGGGLGLYLTRGPHPHPEVR